MASSTLKALALAAFAGLLAGCGEDPAVSGNASATYTSRPTTSSPTTSYPTASSAGSVYGTPTSACGQTSAGSTQTGTTTQTGCGQSTQPGTVAVPGTTTAPVKTGLEAAITDRKESGIFSKSLKSVTVTVTNNDRNAQSRFLLVVFTKKSVEVEVQYRSLTLSPGGSATYPFSATKDADDAKVELQDKLL